MALNMPTEQKATKPTMTTCVHGELSAQWLFLDYYKGVDVFERRHTTQAAIVQGSEGNHREVNEETTRSVFFLFVNL